MTHTGISYQKYDSHTGIIYQKYDSHTGIIYQKYDSCCARDNTELAGVDDHRVSYFLSLCPQDVVSLECRPLAGEYPAQKIMRS